MLQFLKDAFIEELKSFLVFATGSPGLPEFGLGVIQIEFKDTESIFSSACAFCITLPRSFPDQDTFSSALKAVCKSEGKTPFQACKLGHAVDKAQLFLLQNL